MKDKTFKEKIETIITKYSKKEASGELGRAFYIKDMLEEIAPLIERKTRDDIEQKYKGKLGGLQTKIYHLENKPFSEADCARRGEQIGIQRTLEIIIDRMHKTLDKKEHYYLKNLMEAIKGK